MFTLVISCLTMSNLCWFLDLNIPGSYAILFFTALDLTWLYSIYFSLQLSDVSGLAQTLHSFWSCFSTISRQHIEIRHDSNWTATTIWLWPPIFPFHCLWYHRSKNFKFLQGPESSDHYSLLKILISHIFTSFLPNLGCIFNVKITPLKMHQFCCIVPQILKKKKNDKLKLNK